MNLKPLNDNVLVSRQKEEKMIGSIHLPDIAQKHSQEGQVVAVGPGRTLENGAVIAPNVKPGNRVLLADGSGMELKIDGKDFLMVQEYQILGVFEN